MSDPLKEKWDKPSVPIPANMPGLIEARRTVASTGR